MTVATDNQTSEAARADTLLRTVTRLFTELQQRNFACCDVQSSVQCSVLTSLHRENDQTLSALVQRLNLDKAWLSRVTDDLVEQGWLVKAPHPSDRRALRLHLTEAGQAAAQALNDQLNAQAARVLARLPGEDRASTVRLLTGLTQALQAELDGDEPTCC